MLAPFWKSPTLSAGKLDFSLLIFNYVPISSMKDDIMRIFSFFFLTSIKKITLEVKFTKLAYTFLFYTKFQFYY